MLVETVEHSRKLEEALLSQYDELLQQYKVLQIHSIRAARSKEPQKVAANQELLKRLYS